MTHIVSSNSYIVPTAYFQLSNMEQKSVAACKMFSNLSRIVGSDNFQ